MATQKRLWLCLTVFALFLGGCGDSNSAVVKGKVTANGQPVTGGSVQFQPIGSGKGDPGMAAGSEVKSDGTYDLFREKPGDGAVLGKHKVVYIAPVGQIADPQNAKPGDLPPVSPFAGMVPKQAEVDVKSGGNTIDIELQPGPM